MGKNLKVSYISLAVIFVASLIGNINKVAVNVAIIPISEQLNLTTSQTGMILSSFFTTYAFMVLFGGFFADKYGSKRVLTVATIAGGLLGAASGLAGSFVTLLGLRYIFGASQGTNPSASAVGIADLFPKEKRGTAKSILVSAAPLGAACSTIIAAFLATTFGWKAMFAIVGGALALIGVLFIPLYRIPAAEEETTNPNGQEKHKRPFATVLKMPFVWKLTVMQFGFGVFLWGMNSWLPSYFVKVKHLDLKSMGALMAIPQVGAFVFMLFGGVIVDKYFVGREKILICTTTAIAAVCVFLMYTAPTITLAFTYLTIAQISIGVPVPIVYVLALKYIKKEFIGTATGIASFGQQAAGMVSPIIMGYLITLFNGSYDAIFGFVIAAIIMSFLVALTVDTSSTSKEISA